MSSLGIVSASELNRLTSGSYERQRHLIEVLLAFNAEKLFGVKDKAIEILASYDTRVVVQTEGRIYSVAVEQGPRGLGLGKSEELYVKRVTTHQIAKDLAFGVVDALLTQQMDEAVSLSEQLLSVLPEAQELLAYEQVPDQVNGLLGRNASWKQSLSANGAKTEEVLTKPKFGKLYDGSMSRSDSSEFADLVKAELGEQTSELDNLWQEVSALADVLRLNDKPTIWIGLSEDFLADLGQVREVLSSVDSQVYDAPVVGRISDEVAMSLPLFKSFASLLKVSVTN